MLQDCVSVEKVKLYTKLSETEILIINNNLENTDVKQSV